MVVMNAHNGYTTRRLGTKLSQPMMESNIDRGKFLPVRRWVLISGLLPGKPIVLGK
jgi:hypothetical protein